MSQVIQIKEIDHIEENIPPFLFKEISLNDDETVIKIVRKHWVVFRTAFLLGFFVPFVLIFTSIFFSTPFLGFPEIVSDRISMYPLYLSPLFFVLGIILFIWQLYLWYKTVYIITNERLIKIEQESIFASKMHQMYLDKVQDAICRISGLESVLYGYGDISIQGSSETAKIEFLKVAKPRKLQQLIAKEAGKQFQSN